MLRSLLSWFRSGSDRRDAGAGTDADETDDADPADDGEAADEAATESDDGSLWNLIQPWQYRGQYVQSGGDVRDEQERALRDVQRQAEEIEGSDVQHEPPPEE